MKKILIIFLAFLLVFMVSCKKDEKPIDQEDDDEGNKEIEEVVPIEATHSYLVDSDEVNPYFVVKGIPSDNGFIDYTVIIFLNFPRNYQDKVLEKRYYNYIQCDYSTNDEKTSYVHHFDHADDDGGHLSNAIKIAPRYHIDTPLLKLACNLRYEYEVDKTRKESEIKFEEDILVFDETKYSDDMEVENYNFDVVITKKDDEDYNRYKLVIDLDDENKEGHYDIQTWILCDDEVIPFIGYYHYRAMNGDISTVSDEKISIDRNVNVVYYMVRFYDSEGNISDFYYQKRIN